MEWEKKKHKNYINSIQANTFETPKEILNILKIAKFNQKIFRMENYYYIRTLFFSVSVFYFFSSFDSHSRYSYALFYSNAGTTAAVPSGTKRICVVLWKII